MTTKHAFGFSSIAILTFALASACGKDSAPSDVVGAGGSSETGGAGNTGGSGQGGSGAKGGSARGGKGGTAQGGNGGGQGGSGNAGGSGDLDGGSGGTTGDASTGGTPGAGGTGGQPSDCFVNPTTHFEIINACTDSEKVDKNPVLPLLYADGGLPPLP